MYLYQTSTYTSIGSTNSFYSDDILTAKFSKDGTMLAYAGKTSSTASIVIVTPTSALSLIKTIPTTIEDIF